VYIESGSSIAAGFHIPVVRSKLFFDPGIQNLVPRVCRG